MKNIASLVLSLMLAAAVVFPLTAGAQGASKLVKVQGKVELRDAKGKNLGAVRVGTPLKTGETLQASSNGTAAIKTAEGDLVVVSKDSAVRVKDERNVFEQLMGKVLYFFRSTKQTERRVELQTAILGIRGTEFLVDASGSTAAIALKEGKLDVDSKQDGFNVYQRNEADEFEAFKREQREGVERERKEFEEYKAKIREEFIAFQKSVKLEANQSLTIGEGKATIGRIDPSMEETTRNLEEFAKDVR
jgi:hypothetical protein